MNGTGSNSEARKRAAELADPVRVAADRGHRAADLRGEVARLEAEVARLRAMGAPFRVQRVMDARDEFAVEVTAFAAGKIDGQQCLAGVLAVHERLIAAHPAPEGVTLTDAEIRSAGLSEYSHEKVRDRYDADLLMAGFADGIRWLAARQAPTVADWEAVAEVVSAHRVDLAGGTAYPYLCTCGDRAFDLPDHIAEAVVAADPRRTEAQVKAEALRAFADSGPHHHPDQARCTCADCPCRAARAAADRIEADQ